MKHQLAWILGLGISLGCSVPWSSAKGASEEPESVRAKIRELVPKAASLPNKILDALRFGEDFDKFANYSLTMFFLDYTPPAQSEPAAARKAKEREVEVFGGDPSKWMAAISKSRAKGYGSVIQPDSITSFTCQVKGDRASGTISFEAKRLYRSRVEYTARRTKTGWQIEEFRLPAHKVRLTRGPDGKWQKSR